MTSHFKNSACVTLIFSVLLKKIKVSKFNKDLNKTNKTVYIDYFGHSKTSELRKLRM